MNETQVVYVNIEGKDAYYQIRKLCDDAGKPIPQIHAQEAFDDWTGIPGEILCKTRSLDAAKRICRACNAYDKHVEALKVAHHLMTEYWQDLSDGCRTVEDVLAIAEQEK